VLTESALWFCRDARVEQRGIVRDDVDEPGSIRYLRQYFTCAHLMGMRLIDISGQVFGRLTVIRKSEAPSMWECLCSCGTTKLFTGPNLRTGNTTSCGCLHREKLAASNTSLKSLVEPWLADMNLYVRKVGYRRQRGKLGSNQFASVEGSPVSTHPSNHWALDLEAYTSLVTGICHYCGRPPNQLPKGANMNPSLRRNGIDRMDNTRGYEPDNCVSCCASCNREKRAQTFEVFVENTKRRYEHLKTKGLL